MNCLTVLELVWMYMYVKYEAPYNFLVGELGLRIGIWEGGRQGHSRKEELHDAPVVKCPAQTFGAALTRLSLRLGRKAQRKAQRKALQWLKYFRTQGGCESLQNNGVSVLVGPLV